MSKNVDISSSTVLYFRMKDAPSCQHCCWTKVVVNCKLSKLLNHCDLRLTQVLLFGKTSLDVNTNSSVLNATIDFIISVKRFEEPHF